MMTNLWSANTPARFWHIEHEVPDAAWQRAIQLAVSILGLCVQPDDVDGLLALVLGEGQFGPDHWHLGLVKSLYYMCKPLLPRGLTRLVRHSYHSGAQMGFQLGWPIEERYARFQWEVMRQLLVATNEDSLPFTHFWPEGKQFAFVLTHDVETKQGQTFVRAVADLDESFGFRSSFNFVPERYRLDYGLIDELRERGFEIGVHGLNHDGKLFRSHAEFAKRATRINHYLGAFGAVGFRSPCMLRHPEWMQALDIEYDSSFFDTDPYEPIPGGVMSIWPFFSGRFVELPYTLVQDHTLIKILDERTPQIWLTKVDFIERYHGMALLVAHPDYLVDEVAWKVYAEFLQAMRQRAGYWHALPRDVARWWRARSQTGAGVGPANAVQGNVRLGAEGIILGFE